MSSFLPATSLPSPPPPFPDFLLHSYPINFSDVPLSTFERDYMGLGGALVDGSDHSITSDRTAREANPPLFYDTSVLAGADLCGSHLTLAPPGSSDDDDDGNLSDDGETLSGNVGWPPISSYRKATTRSLSIKPSCNVDMPSIMIVPKAIAGDALNGTRSSASLPSILKPMSIYQISKASWIKVSMDGTPIMRKLNLKSMLGYEQLFVELHKLFKFYKSNLSCEVGKDSYLQDFSRFDDYVITYEDGEGDWILLGYTPWETFTQSAKRIRIMKKFK